MVNPVPGGRAQALSQQMLQQAGMADADHSLLSDNLTRTLSKLPEPILERFEATGGKVGPILPDVIQEAAYGSPVAWRPLEKLQRDVAQPYSNAQAVDRVHTVETKLREALEEHHRLNGSYPQTVYVVGSLLSGSFGGNSDADVLFAAGKNPVKVKLADPDHQIEVMYLRPGEEEAQLRYFGSHEVLDPASFLRGETSLMPLFLRGIDTQRHRLSPQNLQT